MKRRRKYIPLRERFASALASLLPQAMRDELRNRKAPADEVIRLFTPDHIKLHAWGGEDKWHNLDMRLRGDELKAKDAADTSRAAKAIRIDQNNVEHKRAMARKWIVPNKRTEGSFGRWPTRKIPSRPFGR